MESLYFVVGNLKANVPMVRVLDTISGVFKDMTVENLVGCIKKGMLHIENATVEDDKLVMIDGDLENYGVIVMTEKGVEIDPVAVAVGEIVDDNNEDMIIGYRFGNTDGRIYNYLIKDIQAILKDYPVANAETFKDEQGIYWLKKGTKPLPKIKRSVLMAAETGAKKTEEKKVETETVQSETVQQPEPTKNENVEEVKTEQKPVEAVTTDIAQKAESSNNADTVKEPETVQTSNNVPWGSNIKKPEPPKNEVKVLGGLPWNKPSKAEKADNAVPKVVIDTTKPAETAEVKPTVSLSKPKYLDTDWVVVTKDNAVHSGALEDIAPVCGLGNGYTVENGVLLSDVQNGNDNIVSIKLPKGITGLGSNIFKDFKALKCIELPKGLKTIGIETFAHCTNLKEVKGTVLKIGRGAFINCYSLSSIDLSATSVIDDYAFSKCMALTDVVLKQIDVLGTGTFYSSGVVRASIGESLRNCGAVLFANCKALTDVTVELSADLRKIMENNYKVFVEATDVDSVLHTSFACMFLNCVNLKNVNIDMTLITKYNNFMFKGSSLYNS